MTTTVDVLFDGQVLRPQTPVDLKADTLYSITITPLSSGVETDAWQVLDTMQGSIEAPEDWSTEHEYYVNGAPAKKGTS